MLTDGKIIEIFCLADDFCKFFEVRMEEYTLHISGKHKYHKGRGEASSTAWVAAA